MTSQERQNAIMDILRGKRSETAKNLAAQFHVSERTIRHDIEVLSCSYPIQTIRGRYGGGICIASWFHSDRKTLSVKQVELLQRLIPALQGEDVAVMNSILAQFAPYRNDV